MNNNNNKYHFLLFWCSAQSHFALLHSTSLALSDTGRNTEPFQSQKIRTRAKRGDAEWMHE